ncbi:AFG1-like ATPase-domain-containing protein [Entophlyctis helioformis]|nr:AFG1-like ATPase-domain-containing protein [Entophlyctis helioformis]
MVVSGKLRNDPHQRQTVALLQSLYRELLAYNPPVLPPPKVEKKRVMAEVGNDAGREKILSPDFAWIDQNEQTVFGMFKSLFESKAAADSVSYGPKGLYLFGDVGTGKTMVMDLFYKTIPIERKRRVHFHAFMQDTHKRIHQLRVHEGITEAWLLCFDELQVTDITDAMILRRLFSELFKRGVVTVMTSNRHPNELYQNGIQRASFLPAIDLLKERCVVHSLNSGIDYRRQGKHISIGLDAAACICPHSPLDIETDDMIRRLFNDLRGSTPGKCLEARELSFWGRKLIVREAAGRIAKIPFKQLCGEAHSAADYLELVKHFDTILLTDIPGMTLAHRNEARRFITLIDAMYENKIRLVATMESNLLDLFSGEPHTNELGQQEYHGMQSAERLLMDDLKLTTEQLTSSMFTGAEEVFAFQRAVSRLIEMQTHAWVGDDLAKAIDKVTAA